MCERMAMPRPWQDSVASTVAITGPYRSIVGLLRGCGVVRGELGARGTSAGPAVVCRVGAGRGSRWDPSAAARRASRSHLSLATRSWGTGPSARISCSGGSARRRSSCSLTCARRCRRASLALGICGDRSLAAASVAALGGMSRVDCKASSDASRGPNPAARPTAPGIGWFSGSSTASRRVGSSARRTLACR